MQHALVLGAGIMGLSTAGALARAGWAVRVVEQDPVPYPRGSSLDGHQPIRHAYGDARDYMQMIDPAGRAWELLFAEAGAPGGYTETIAHTDPDTAVAWTPAGVNAQRAEIEIVA